MTDRDQCNVCRGRKSKCDGAKPRCRLCTELNAECIYQEPGIKLDAGDRMILERLDRIEGFLQSSWSGPASTTGSISLPPSRSATTAGIDGLPDERIGGTHSGGFAAKTAVMLPPTRLEDNVSLMRPVTQWPKISDLVSKPYDLQAMLQLELDQEPLNLDASLSLDLKNNAMLAQTYFDNANIWYACIDPYDWNRIYEKASRSDFREGSESCLILLVLALGAISHSKPPSVAARDAERPGMPYFSAAWGMLPTLIFNHEIIASQCAILAAAYLCYLTRPLEAWTLLSTTIPKLQVLLSKSTATAYQRSQLSTRVYWNALLLESSILTSLDLPPSTLATLTTTVPLPAPFPPSPNSPPSHQDDPWLLSALISFSRLKDKIAYQTALPSATQGPIATALDTSLHDLYASLPLPDRATIPPPRHPLPHPALAHLRTHYFLARTRIFRPYILSVLADEAISLAPLSLCRDSCRVCIDSAVRVLEDLPASLNIAPWLKWQTALASVDAALLLMGVLRSANLSLLVQDVEHVDELLKGVVGELDRVRPRAPSLTRAVEVLGEAEGRRKGGR